ncbi:MAG: TetR family transcriptional regulator, partial [Gordonibacter pamelaeae]
MRERKRCETRAAIERAAISLVDELGYDNVTVAMISERAVVSQGTFFNYFPTKDAAIVGLGRVD